jgi:hypothetical protein
MPSRPRVVWTHPGGIVFSGGNRAIHRQEFEAGIRQSHVASIRPLQRAFEQAGVTFQMDDEGKALGISVSPTDYWRTYTGMLDQRNPGRPKKPVG